MARAIANVRVQQNESGGGDEVQRSLEMLDRVLSEYEEIPPTNNKSPPTITSSAPDESSLDGTELARCDTPPAAPPMPAVKLLPLDALANGSAGEVLEAGIPQPPSPSQHSEDDGYMSMNGRSNKTKFSPSFGSTEESESPIRTIPSQTTTDGSTSVTLDSNPDATTCVPPSPEEAEKIIATLLPWSPNYQDSGGNNNSLTPVLQATLPKTRPSGPSTPHNPYNSLPPHRAPAPPVLGVCITAVHAAVLSDRHRPLGLAHHPLIHDMCGGRYNEHPVTIYPGKWDRTVPPKTLAGSYERHREVRRVSKPQMGNPECLGQQDPIKSYDFKKSESFIINNTNPNLDEDITKIELTKSYEDNFHRPLRDLLGANDEEFSDDSLEENSLPPPPTPPSDTDPSRDTSLEFLMNDRIGIPIVTSLSYGNFPLTKNFSKEFQRKSVDDMKELNSSNDSSRSNEAGDDLDGVVNDSSSTGACKRNSIAWEVPIGEDFKPKSLKRRSASGPLKNDENSSNSDKNSGGEFWPDPPVCSEINDVLSNSVSDELWPTTPGHGTYVIRRRKQRQSLSNLSKSASTDSEQMSSLSTELPAKSHPLPLDPKPVDRCRPQQPIKKIPEWSSKSSSLNMAANMAASSSSESSSPINNIRPLREIESNISAILRGEIIPEKTPRGFRNIHKSESAKEMLLQNFPPLPPEPIGSPDTFPPLPPSPVQEEEEFTDPPSLPDSNHGASGVMNNVSKVVQPSIVLGRVGRHKADTLPGENSSPPVVPPHRSSPSMLALKTRSMDAGFGKSYLRHSSETMAPLTSRRARGMHGLTRRPAPLTPHHQSPTTAGHSIGHNTSCSLPDTPTFSRGCGDIPRAGSATSGKLDDLIGGSRTQPRTGMPNLNPHLHSATVGHGIHVSGLNSGHLSGLTSMGGPARGWYPRNKPRPLSTENLDRLSGHPSIAAPRPLAWGGEPNRKPQTLPPNLSPKFFHKSPREALRRVTSLLIRKGNGTAKEPRKDREGSVFPMPHTPIAHRDNVEDGNQKQRRGFLKNFFKKSKHYSLDQQ